MSDLSATGHSPPMHAFTTEQWNSLPQDWETRLALSLMAFHPLKGSLTGLPGTPVVSVSAVHQSAHSSFVLILFH